jgi:hypothetical protein
MCGLIFTSRIIIITYLHRTRCNLRRRWICVAVLFLG